MFHLSTTTKGTADAASRPGIWASFPRADGMWDETFAGHLGSLLVYSVIICGWTSQR